MRDARVSDAIKLNKAVGYARSDARRPLVIHRLGPEQMTFIGISDAGGTDGGVLREDASLGDPRLRWYADVQTSIQGVGAVVEVL